MLFLFLNELATFATMLIVFPGLLPPRDGLEFFMDGMMFFVLSFVWWIFLAVSPIAFAILYASGAWHPRDYLKEWPLKHLRR